jgi:hypothetical protein
MYARGDEKLYPWGEDPANHVLSICNLRGFSRFAVCAIKYSQPGQIRACANLIIYRTSPHNFKRSHHRQIKSHFINQTLKYIYMGF